MKDGTALIKASFAFKSNSQAVCCTVSTTRATLCEIGKTLRSIMFPVCAERVSMVLMQGLIKTSNHGQTKQIKILMQPLVQTNSKGRTFAPHLFMMICGLPDSEGSLCQQSKRVHQTLQTPQDTQMKTSV